MHIRTFTVEGFAGFTRPMAVGPLHGINVFHGANNTGKSCLLRAVDLYFRLLGAGEAVTKAQRQILDDAPAELLERIQAAVSRTEPVPIIFRVEWEISQRALQDAGLPLDHECARVLTVLEVNAIGRTPDLKIESWFLGQKDVSSLDKGDKGEDGALVHFGQQIRRLLADARPFQQDQPILPFVFIGDGAELFPQELRDRLFDARQSLTPASRRRWTLFAELAGSVSNELGPGEWDTSYTRETSAGDIVYLQKEGPVRLEHLGAGLQRFLRVVAELCLAEERVVAMEEPEWRLSPELQTRLIRMTRRIVREGIGVRQVLISTHSPYLCAGTQPFRMEVVDGSPVAEQAMWEVAGLEPAQEDVEEQAAGDETAALGNLIGLVDSLAALEPDALLAAPAR